ncbi:MAG: hypothetical protein JSR86_06875 [Proteobacteria bacterium]|nr:hypothetical protein [Pseudomonadota bacterium]
MTDTDVTHVRQARRGRHAFMILAASTVLALVAVFGVFAYRGHDLQVADHQPTSKVAQAPGSPSTRTPPAGYPQAQ